MASIWKQAKGQAPVKLVGNLHPRAATAAFPNMVVKAARAAHATIEYRDDMQAILRLPDTIAGAFAVAELTKGEQVTMWIEVYSPPSAPETNQPKLLYRGEEAVDGVLVTKAGAFTIGVPK